MFLARHMQRRWTRNLLNQKQRYAMTHLLLCLSRFALSPQIAVLVTYVPLHPRLQYHGVGYRGVECTDVWLFEYEEINRIKPFVCLSSEGSQLLCRSIFPGFGGL